MAYFADLLHEACHIAVTEENLRPLIGSNDMVEDWPSDGDEIASILWSYAAAVHLDIGMNEFFHDGGYKKDSKWLIDQFNNKNYIGLPLLQWMQLCDANKFPKMKKWLR